MVFGFRLGDVAGHIVHPAEDAHDIAVHGGYRMVVDDGDGNAVFRIVATTGLPTAAQAVTFKGLGTGGFLPVTVDYVLATGTTVAELIAAR